MTNNVVCTNCNGVGHIARDCKERKPTTGPVNQSKIDEEYMSLIAELGEGPPPPKTITGTLFMNSSSMGPTIGMSSQAPKAIAAPPPPPPTAVSTTSQSTTPLLPTPNLSQSNWGGSSVPSAWPTSQSGYGSQSTNASAYPMSDAYSPNSLYSTSNTTPMGWNQSNNCYSIVKFILVLPILYHLCLMNCL